ncbi:hypothetical protein EON79_11840, partial [bacterium]
MTATLNSSHYPGHWAVGRPARAAVLLAVFSLAAWFKGGVHSGTVDSLYALSALSIGPVWAAFDLRRSGDARLASLRGTVLSLFALASAGYAHELLPDQTDTGIFGIASLGAIVTLGLAAFSLALPDRWNAGPYRDSYALPRWTGGFGGRIAVLVAVTILALFSGGAQLKAMEEYGYFSSPTALLVLQILVLLFLTLEVAIGVRWTIKVEGASRLTWWGALRGGCLVFLGYQTAQATAIMTLASKIHVAMGSEP